MSRHLRHLMFVGLLALAAGLAGCEKAEQIPTPTPHQESIQAAGTLFAPPTQPPRITPTPTPLDAVELELSRVVARMEQAVLGGDPDAYLRYVWADDPVFYREQAGWAQDWAEHPLRRFELSLTGIDTSAPDVASARMSILWSLAGSTATGSAGGATITAVFHRADDGWLFGGEQWQTLDAAGFRLHYFNTPLLSHARQAELLLEELPAVHTRLTRELGYTPAAVASIKLYESAATLQTMTRLSIPLLAQWSAPGESIKVILGPYNAPPETSEVAREYARFLLYEMAGGSREPYPWWLEHGLGEYGASLFRTASQRNRVLERVASVASGEPGDVNALLAWDDLETPPDLEPHSRAFAVEQAYTFILYLTEQHGADARNGWLQAVAGGQDLDAAAQAHLGGDLAALDRAWRAWLPAQIS